MHQLVRVYTYTNPDLMSVPGVPGGAGGNNSVTGDFDDHTISTHHTADGSSVYTGAQVCLSRSLGFKGLFLYTVVILCNVECCIRKL